MSWVLPAVSQVGYALSVAKVRDLKFKKEATRSSSTMKLDADTADLIRRLASYEGKRLSELLNDMLVVYVRTEHPNLELVFDDGSSEDVAGDLAAAGQPSTNKRRKK